MPAYHARNHLRVLRAHLRTTFAVVLATALVAGCGGKSKTDETPAPAAVPEHRPGNTMQPTTATTTISGDELRNLPSQRIEDYLSSRVAGLHVYRDESGQYTIRIRGTAKLRATDEEPLIVIDNIPVQPGGNSMALAALDTREIATVEVLKDAAATAIYGSRGSNGVLVIKSRRGVHKP